MQYTTITKSFLFLSLMALTLACTKTITTTREPALAVTADSLRFELSKLVICENIDLVEKEIRPEGSPSTFKLEVNVINGENLPSDKNELKELGKQVMAIVKSRLKDVEKFDTCFVLFETQSGSGAVKTKKWNKFEFKPSEI